MNRIRREEGRLTMISASRRRLITAAAAIGTFMSIGEHFAWAAASERSFDFTTPLEGWTTVSGKWAIEEVPYAPQGGRALVQQATGNDFNVIVAAAGPYDAVDVSVRF